MDDIWGVIGALVVCGIVFIGMHMIAAQYGYNIIGSLLGMF